MGLRANLSRRWKIIVPVVVLAVVAVVALVIFVPKTQAAPEQPLEFNHQAMVSQGIDCLYCHSGARRSPEAGMPSVEKCMGCHNVVDTSVPVIQKLAGYWQRQETIPWVRVNSLPRYVFFSHEVHVNNGVNCENCHGDVAHMTVAQPVVNMNMGWCLNCHEKQKNAQQLVDCVICHR